ncbi:MAG: MerR family transcriptional regulator [Anaerolineales bacterium]
MGKATRPRDPARKYSIKTVCAETGLLPVTLRAWEARYKVVAPARSKGNYRLYSEADLSLLRWVKKRVDAGEPIRLVAAEAARLRRAGKRAEAPAAHPLQGGAPAKSADCLYAALMEHRENAADRCLKVAQARFDLPAICLDVMTPCLWRIGDAWERGAIRIADEHFASTYIRGQLLAWFQAESDPRRGGRILVGCGPMEFHDIGSLMLALLLRRRRRRVDFLGQDLDLEDLRAYIQEIRPALVCLSANAEPAARRLIGFEKSLEHFRPHPVFGFGGRAFNQIPSLRKTVSGVFLGETLAGAMTRIQDLL